MTGALRSQPADFEGPTPPTGERLTGKVAIVTGGGQAAPVGAIGTGAAISRLLARAGAAVLIVDHNKAAALRTADVIAAEGGHARVCLADIGREDDCVRAAARAVSEFWRR